MARLGRRQELKARWPAGSAAPSGYVDWHEWAEAQTLHGLKQRLCVTCGRYRFPQELSQLGGCADQADCWASVKRWGKLATVGKSEVRK